MDLHGDSEQTLIKGPNSERADMSNRVWPGAETGRFFLRVEGPDNHNEMRVVFPLGGLGKGDPVVFDIMDRDANGDSAIDHVELNVRGRRDCIQWRRGEWILRDKDVAAGDVVMVCELEDGRGDFSWSVATDR